MRRSWLVGALGVVLLGGVIAAILLVVNRGDGDGDRPALGTPQEGGTLRMAVVSLQTLDPARRNDATSVMVADLLFDTLVTYDAETLAPEAGIAESWEASFDQKQFTFVLREGLAFHDGTPVDATDVKATLERMAAPDFDTDFGPVLELIAGYVKYHDERAAEGLSGVVVADERTIKITLNEPFAALPVALGNPGFGIVPSERAADPTFGESPVGSGPLKFGGSQGDVISLTRYDAYQPRPAFVDGVDLRLLTDPNAAFELLRDEKVDLAPVPADRVNEAAAEYGEPGFGPFLGTLFYGMNLEAPVFQDARVRQAVLLAVDRDRIVDLVYKDAARLADGLLAPGVPEFVDDACGDRCDHDAERARQLVAEVYPDGTVPTVRIDFDDDGKQRAVASAIQSDLEAAGIPAELRPHDFKDYAVFLVREQPELFRLGWTADYPSADGFLYPLFVSGQENNLMRFSALEVDQVLKSARAERDATRRADLYRSAEQLILDRVPVLPIAQFGNRWAAAPYVGGFEMSPLGTFSIADVFLADRAAVRS